MMTDAHFNSPSGAAAAKFLSPILVVVQWAFSLLFLTFLIVVLFMAVPSGFRENLIATAPRPISPVVVMSGCLAGAVVAAGWFFVLKLLRGVVTAVIHGDPFLPENINRLRNIWIILAATEIFRMIVFYFMSDSDGITNVIQVDVRLGTWFFIFVIAVISEAFRHGAALRAEQELTI